MSICGYHPKMGVGIQQFAEGLISALSTKARKNDRRIAQHMIVEADEVFVLKRFLENEQTQLEPESEQRAAVEAFLGIVYVAQFMMDVPRKIASSEEGLSSTIREHAHLLTDLLQRFEDDFEASPDAPAINKARRAFAKTFKAVGR